MEHFIYNNTIYELTDSYNFNNNKLISEINKKESCYYNLPIALLNKKKIIIKKLNNINLIDFLKKILNLHYYSEKTYYKIKFKKLPIFYKKWFLYIQDLFKNFNTINHIIMKKYHIKINNMINPADFMIIEDDIKGLLSPNGKKYYLRKHTIDQKYNPYDKNIFAKKNMIDLFNNSLLFLKKNYYKINI